MIQDSGLVRGNSVIRRGERDLFIGGTNLAPEDMKSRKGSQKKRLKKEIEGGVRQAHAPKRKGGKRRKKSS